MRFKRVIMDEDATDRSPHPPQEPGYKRVIFCSGKVLALRRVGAPVLQQCLPCQSSKSRLLYDA